MDDVRPKAKDKASPPGGGLQYRPYASLLPSFEEEFGSK